MSTSTRKKKKGYSALACFSAETDPVKEPTQDEKKPEKQAQAPGKQDVQKKGRTTHVWMKTDPLAFPPNEYRRGVFKANQPLVKIINGVENMPAFNKFSLKMKPETRKYVVQHCGAEIAKSKRVFPDNSTERKSSDFHRALVRDLKMFTLPSDKERIYFDECTMHLESLTGKKRKRVDVFSPLEPLTDQADLVIDILEQRLSGSKNEDVQIGNEARPRLDDEESGRGFGDMMVYVYGKKSKVSEGESSSISSSSVPDPLKLAAVLEEKSDNDKEATYQGAAYACQEAPLNIANNHSNPIYVITIGASKWTYSILHARGVIAIKNGAIVEDDSSIQGFRAQEAVMQFKERIELKTLKERLASGTEYYQNRFSDYSSTKELVYPDGMYLVGTLYVAQEWYSLPGEQCSGRAMDTHRFYEGLLRCIVGDQVVGWSISDIIKVRMLRERINADDNELFMGGALPQPLQDDEVAKYATLLTPYEEKEWISSYVLAYSF